MRIFTKSTLWLLQISVQLSSTVQFHQQNYSQPKLAQLELMPYCYDLYFMPYARKIIINLLVQEMLLV